MSRPLLAAAFVFALTACAPDAASGTQRIEVEGVITAVAAAGGSGRSYMLDVPGEGYLAISLPDARPPAHVRGVIVQVPANSEIPADTAGEFAALTALSEESGDPLAVVDYLR